ncbi:MAG: TIGR01777 family protein [Acidimicrobiaceae bacterium]|nr:TIGR01777 family protein [Acidimicrobiaceae bacterium]MBT5581987.1 TIGR01777 family protein [Acidimicrobiaceae bacterium]MBT5850058.1 TIGR01777 family protein [Acidimicrobiaceae bacterium]
MKVLVSGSTGFIGSALMASLRATGHSPVPLVRGSASINGPGVRWDPAGGTIDHDGIAAAGRIDAVIHLAGEGLAEHRWSQAQKAKILESRIHGTRLLASTMASLDAPPAVFLSGSAIGFYGDRGDEKLTEESAPGLGFASEVVQAWEASTNPLDQRTRVTHLRTGIVLDPSGGALAEQLPFFTRGLGGRIGKGTQWMSWISLTDHIAAMLWLLDHPVAGAVNLTAPNPVTNTEFTKTLGAAVRRPAIIPTPTIALWAKLGRQLTRELLLSSAHVSPCTLLAEGFVFEHPRLERALTAALRD